MTDERLWDYADGLLDQPEKTRVEAYLRQHPEWQLRLNAILEEKQELTTMPLEAPDAGFANRVLVAWAVEQGRSPASAKGTDWIIRSIILAFLLFVLSPMVVLVVSAAQLPAADQPLVRLPEAPAIDWSALASSPVLLYGLLLLAGFWLLRLLDKVLQQKVLAPKLA
ncbi:MAG: hypothetical protein JNK89_11175 [Saprospiraceae bacterium]|nr:hypothetical protein [Saprospiraceae bacterium]